MKNLLNNKKGFTLIELLAVIVILAILVMVAIPAVTKILTESRQSTFADNARAAINTVRTNYISSGSTGSKCYDKAAIDKLLEKELNESPFGGSYASGAIRVTQTTDTNGDFKFTYEMCLIDEGGNGTDGFVAENNIKKETIKADGTLSSKKGTCVCTATP